MRSRIRVAALTLATVMAMALPVSASDAAQEPNGNNGGKDIVSTTENYVTAFYPIWFTHFQTQVLPVPANEFIGPEKISPVYQAVVAINDDTLYASTPIDVRGHEVVVDVPATSAGYSVLLLDAWGNVHPVGIPSKGANVPTPDTTYSLIGPGYTGPITGEVTVPLPMDQMILIFRVDKYSGGMNMTTEATTFRHDLAIDGVGTAVKPVAEFGAPVKTLADLLIRTAPIDFLTQLQTAVASDWTPALTQQEAKLSDDFDALFGDGMGLTASERQQFADGAKSAHDAIINNYLDNRGATNWTHFTNIGLWKKKVLDRASITEFCQYCNTKETAAYYHAFYDGSGAALTGSRPDGYVLTFPPGATPEASRFWSLTAYTPDAIQPIPNPIDKYLVASYTEGLQTNADGSISIYISRTQPDGVATANWLPVGDREFNLMLRVYGVVPKSNIAKDKYIPPAIMPR
ncbi:protein of unknown function DUF1214 [Nakamurella multipartita DSM 44233]|uniref:DUF1254 domain-containing protein n=2 Tax=Nakamurella TaxID=53460 RepID=C8X7M1_NAKMY|nr:protein of unknown function DUF1214 [Nakamurella multipartita DSM 44233]